MSKSRLTAGEYGTSVTWEVDLHVDLTQSPTVVTSLLSGPSGSRSVVTALNTALRTLTYTVGRYELPDPGAYALTVDIQVATGLVERVSYVFNVYQPGRLPD